MGPVENWRFNNARSLRTGKDIDDGINFPYRKIPIRELEEFDFRSLVRRGKREAGLSTVLRAALHILITNF